MALKQYTAISLFTGAMGLDLGLERTRRFKILACVEKEASACETIRRNRDKGRISNRKLRVYQGDIGGMDPLTILRESGLRPGELDLLVGGPPCQSFSTAGSRGTVQDHRGTLLWQFLRFVEIMRPKFFVMENVRGLLSAALRHRPIKQRPVHGGSSLADDEKPGSVVRQFALDLGKLPDPYRMDCFEVNAVNYGAPQLRERALFIGNRYNAIVDFAPPTHGPPDDQREIDAASDLLFTSVVPRPKLLPWRTLRDAIGSLDEYSSEIMDFSPRKKAYLSMIPPGSNWRSLPLEIQKASMGKVFIAKGGRSGWWRRLSFDLPCPTLVTMPNHAGTSLCHPTETRALSLKEYALIQEFPPEWEFCGKTAEKYAQVGNAVPVRLGEVVGSVVAEEIVRLAKARWRVRTGCTDQHRIVYVQSHVRTRQWFKNGNVVVWNDGEKNGAAKYASPKTKLSIRPLVAAQAIAVG